MSYEPKKTIKVLLIEDSESDALLVQIALRRARQNYEITHVTDLQQAQQTLSHSPSPDVALVDLSLPDSHGWSTVENIREITSSVPLIVLTGNSDEEMAIHALQEGISDYVVKSRISDAELERVILYALLRYVHTISTERLLKELRKAKHLLQKKNKHLRKLYKTAQSFVNQVSHEFRTPLTVIKEYTSLLSDEVAGPLAEQQLAMLNVVNDRANDLNRMVDDMLDIGRIDSGLCGVRREACDIRDILAHIMPNLERKAAIKEVTLTIDVPDSVPEVFCDTDMIGRVIINLAVNAIKFSGDPGFVKIIARYNPSDGMVQIKILDNGAGIDPADQATVFRQFKQLSQTRHSSTKGFGLGLGIAKELVEINLGAIELESEVGVGTMLTFSIPSARSETILHQYLSRLNVVADRGTKVTALRISVDDSEPAAEVQQFLDQIIRRDDLIFRVAPDRWLYLLSEESGKVKNFIKRVNQLRMKTNRNRPQGPLPELKVENLHCWQVPSQLAEAEAEVEKQISDSDTFREFAGSDNLLSDQSLSRNSHVDIDFASQIVRSPVDVLTQCSN